MMRFFDSRAQKDQINLQPGEILVTNDDVILYTVLGSCISVCLYDETIGLAGMNHFILPKRGSSGIPFAQEEEGRFGDEAIERLLRRMFRKGAHRVRLVAKIFGASSAFGRNSEACVAKSNRKAAFDILVNEGIPIVAEDTGGMRGRRIYFDTSSGRVRVEVLRESQIDSCDPPPKSSGPAAAFPSTNKNEKSRMKSTP